MTLQDNLKAFKDYINYKAIIVGLIVLFVSYSIIFTSFEQYAGFTAIIVGFLLYIELNYMTQSSKENSVNFLIIVVIGFLALHYLFGLF